MSYSSVYIPFVHCKRWSMDCFRNKIVSSGNLRLVPFLTSGHRNEPPNIGIFCLPAIKWMNVCFMSNKCQIVLHKCSKSTSIGLVNKLYVTYQNSLNCKMRLRGCFPSLFLPSWYHYDHFYLYYRLCPHRDDHYVWWWWLWSSRFIVLLLLGLRLFRTTF